MDRNKSDLDNLYHHVFGESKKKTGAAFEELVCLALSIKGKCRFHHDQRLKGYNGELYQLDGWNENEKITMEAKDYSISGKKVGRMDLQQLEGALSNLDVEGSIFASATGYTEPAIKFAENTPKNPKQVEIALFHIRPSTKEDERGRINSFVFKTSFSGLNFRDPSASCEFMWSDEGKLKIQNLQEVSGAKEIRSEIEFFYTKDGVKNHSSREVQYEIAKIHSEFSEPGSEGKTAHGCLMTRGYHILFGGKLYELKGIEYNIPYFHDAPQIHELKKEGESVLFFKSEDGRFDTLLTDDELRKGMKYFRNRGG